MLADDTSLILEEWGHWAKIRRGVNLGYARMHTGPSTTRRREPMISDAVAFEVDSAVAMLCHRDEDMGNVVVLHFVRGWSQRKLAREMKRSHNTIRGMLNGGVAWISEVLDSE